MIDAVLDTTILIDLLRGHSPAVQWAQSLSAQRGAITPIVWMEIVQGAQNSRELLELTRFLRQFRIEHPTIADNNWAMRQFGRFNLSHRIDMADVDDCVCGCASRGSTVHAKHPSL